MDNFIITIKNSLYIPAFLIGIGLEKGLAEGLTALIFLMIIDFITGLLRSYKNNGASSIRSSIAIAGVLSKSVVLLIPFSLVIMGRGVGIDMVSYIGGIVSMLIISETYSIFGNIYSIRVGKNLPEYDVVAVILKKIREGLLSLLDKS